MSLSIAQANDLEAEAALLNRTIGQHAAAICRGRIARRTYPATAAMSGLIATLCRLEENAGTATELTAELRSAILRLTPYVIGEIQ